MNKIITVLVGFCLFLGMSVGNSFSREQGRGGRASGGHETRQSGRSDARGGRTTLHDNHRGSYGRIDAYHYNAHFGREHSFRIGYAGRYEGGFYRFNYGGFAFGYAAWPIGWAYTDNCYVVYDPACDCYFMYNTYHPGVSLRLTIF